jgi:hypothetical protein
MNESLLKRYILNFDIIYGWLDFSDIQEFKALNSIHQQNNIKGNLLEIGVYNGKTFILLSLFLKENERIVGVDCFQDQKVNISQSASICSQKRVERNIQKIYLQEKKHLNFKLIKSDSRFLKPKDYLDFADNELSYRIIHIDGGHDENTCSIDLNNSANILCKNGYIIIDDYQNFNKDKNLDFYHGEGVTKAVDKFLLENKNFKIVKKLNNKLIVIKN